MTHPFNHKNLRIQVAVLICLVWNISWSVLNKFLFDNQILHHFNFSNLWLWTSSLSQARWFYFIDKHLLLINKSTCFLTNWILILNLCTLLKLKITLLYIKTFLWKQLLIHLSEVECLLLMKSENINSLEEQKAP